MAAGFSSAVLRAIAGMNPRALAAAFRRALGRRRIALCFHRVADPRREGELLPKLTMAAPQIDALIEFMVHAAARRDRWLTVSFDDGYGDSAAYLLERAPRWPDVEWLYFVCPQKTERQVGFRWDLAEVLRRERPSLDDDSIIFAPIDPRAENLRQDLQRLAARPEFALADLQECLRIQRLPNAALGNHTNAHHRAVLLTPGQFGADLAASMGDFARLFGPPRHFAFPFGVPEEDFRADHVAAVRAHGPVEIWSTEARPYHPRERESFAVLPRFAVDGTRSWRESVAHIIVRSLRPGGCDRYPREADR